MSSYKNWIHHVEAHQPLYADHDIAINAYSIFVDDMFRMVQEAFGHPKLDPHVENVHSTENEHSEESNDDKLTVRFG